MKPKRKLPLRMLAGLSLIGLASVGWGQGISGTPHDFSDRSLDGKLCEICHVPHNGTPNPPAPLWQGPVTSTVFTPYSSDSLNAQVGQPDGVSMACLTCHDGTVALDSFGASASLASIDAPFLLGSNLSNDHPVSFTYDAALAATDGGLEVPTSSEKVDQSGLLRLFEGKVQCSTCHDPHNNTHGKFLTMDNTTSAMCISCHRK